VLVGVAGGLDSDPARSVSLPGGTTDDTTTGGTTTGTTTGDAATTGATTTDVTRTGRTTTLGGDISGPCDEAEHRNDPRCTGAAGDDDNSGPGSGDDRDDDREDNSGPGSGDDRDDDDRSGSNSGRG